MTKIDRQTVTYTISQLADEFQVTSRALRLYEEEGLLSPERVGTRRIFHERERVRLRLVLRGKRLGWSLSEIRELIDLYDSSHGEEAQLERMLEKLEDRREMLEVQKQDVELALADLEQIAGNAQAALDTIRGGQNKAGYG
ncbi:MAG: MerR family DNA-binding transcriptional regulator [Proteobacteria bacterium]|nr:MerR family DNA-binding transcriptional regulator [Pseudomonadota bacterium]